jgi:hypothetical protein
MYFFVFLLNVTVIIHNKDKKNEILFYNNSLFIDVSVIEVAIIKNNI